MRILLASPRLPRDTFWSFDRALTMSGRRATMPPLGLLTVAGLIPARHELSFVDENVRPVTDREIRAADVVFLSAMVAQRAALEELVARCERLGVRSVVGGPLVSGAFEELVADGSRATALFIGEAEELLAELLADLEGGEERELRPAYAHVVDEDRAQRIRSLFGDAAAVRVAPRPTLVGGPVPRFDLLELDAYHSMAVQASRGCPIGCEFCDIWPQLGRKVRAAPSEQMIEQLDHLLALGWQGRVFVVDDNFIGNVGAARSLLGAIADWRSQPARFELSPERARVLGPRRVRGLRRAFRLGRSSRRRVAFTTEADVRLGDPGPKMTALREAMVKAGFRAVFLGLESPASEALEEARKRVNVGPRGDALSHQLECVERIQRAGLEPMSGFIIGFDNEPADIHRRMVDFVERAGIPLAMVGLLGVLPGTELQRRLVREGRFRGRLEGVQTHRSRLNFEPVGRTERDVIESYEHVLATLYGPDGSSYFRRCETLLRRLPAPPPTGESLGLRHLRTFVRSLASVRPRRAYWRFLLRTALRDARFLPTAIALGIQGDHLHRLTQSRLRRTGEGRSARLTALPSKRARTA